MLVTRIERIRDEKGLDTAEAYVTFGDNKQAESMVFPLLPEGCEVTVETIAGPYLKTVNAYVPVSVPGADEDRLERLKEDARFTYSVSEFVSFGDIVAFCDVNSKPYSTYKSRPFSLVSTESFTKSGSIARFQDVDASFVPKTWEMRLEELKYACEYILKQNENEGHTYMFYPDFCAKLQALLKKSHRELAPNQQPSAILRHFPSIFYLDNFLSNHAKVALSDTRDLEYSIYNAIIARKNMASPYMDFDASSFEGLSDEQQSAVEGCMITPGRVSVVTGGPGTGKTTVLSCIVDGLTNQYGNVKVAMLAPTGKAAKRIGEVMGGRDIKISTVHKFIGWGRGNFITNAMKEEMHSYDVIIVDEFSMADIEIFWMLIENIYLDRTKIILVGDANQLPSVGAGNLLADLIALGIPTYKLTKNFRSAGFIAENAKRIINGQVFLEEGPDFKIVDVSETSWLSAAAYSASGLFASKDVATISPYRKEAIMGSSSGINDVVQSALFAGRGNTRCGKFFRGDRVIFTRTKYASGSGDLENNSGYYNGELGVIVSYSGADLAYTVAVDGRTVEVTDDNDMELAYSITIHKSQGSEYDEVAISIPKASPFVTRRMFYTAVTRAKKKVTVYATPSTIRATIANNADEVRRTFLAYRAETM